MCKSLFKTNKIYRFVDGRDVVIVRIGNGWKFNYRDVTRFTIFEIEMRTEHEILDKLVEFERDDLVEAIEKLERFCPDVQMPTDETIRKGVVSGIEDFNLMDDVQSA